MLMEKDIVKLRQLLEEYKRREEEVEQLKREIEGNKEITKTQIKRLLIAIMHRNKCASEIENELRKIFGLDRMRVEVMIEEVR